MQDGRTTLHWAAGLDRAEMVQLLLDVRVDLAGVQDKVQGSCCPHCDWPAAQEGKTALHLASERNHVEVVWLLLEHHPELATSKDGELDDI